jgi:hypothetical protein
MNGIYAAPKFIFFVSQQGGIFIQKDHNSFKFRQWSIFLFPTVYFLLGIVRCV